MSDLVFMCSCSLEKLDELDTASNDKRKEILNHPLFYAAIQPVHVVQPSTFKFEYRLHTKDKDNVTFNITYNNIKEALIEAKRNYFHMETFPTITTKNKTCTHSTSIGRKIPLQKQIKLLDDHIYWDEDFEICRKPGYRVFGFGGRINANENDMNILGSVLSKLVNTPHFAATDDFYDILGINDIKPILQPKAQAIVEDFNNRPKVNRPFRDLDVEASSEQKHHGKTQCNLDNAQTCWMPKDDDVNPYLKIDLKLTFRIARLNFLGSQDNKNYIKGCDIYYGLTQDTQSLRKITNKNIKTIYKNKKVSHFEVKLNIVARYIRINIDRDSVIGEPAFRFTLYESSRHTCEYSRLTDDNGLKDEKFEAFFVVSRPTKQDKAVSTLDHWAAIFEGDNYLLTLQWFEDSTFGVSVERNTCLGQTRSWYSYVKKFKKRWEVKFQINLKKSDRKQTITGKYISQLLKEWIKFRPEYELAHNNCQHFVRDITSVFSKNAAKCLFHNMDNVIIDKIINPMVELADRIQEDNQMNAIREKLLKL